ncbi:MAG: addA [Gammaproteobacteria bacterium]|jgi:ATP-dependent exoDNAse (exonuclease V) beta subunit|nr:addA [Gammaproteobacteria bacterium]
MIISDESARQAALDMHHSVIVQAPAGSGKTEILCRRFLTALASVNQPEQVLAITFTKKAANEMRERILRYLQDPSNIFAKPVLQKDQEKNWQLLLRPERLQVMTIDGLCARIVEESPVHSGIFAYEVEALPGVLYQQATQRMLEEADQAYPWQQALHALLLQCDNRWQKLQHLLIDMLAKREQWLMLLPVAQNNAAWREQLERNLTACLEEAINAVRQGMPEHLVHEVTALIKFANSNGNPLDVSTDNFWLCLPKFLLTQDGNLRKTVDKRLGFPTGEKEEKAFFKSQKEKMLAVLKQVAETPGLTEALQMLAIAPPEKYHEDEWQSVQFILQVLQGLMVYWQEVMQEQQACDFTEIALRALMVLGQEGAPTDLALAFDYRLQHVLVDEFQDTSLLQYRLLERLTQGWQEGDGRTLFLVGDPLQSIYRFRQAEVGLFLRVWQQGFGHLNLQTIQLTQNFRSQKALVDFYNEKLSQVLPAVSMMEEGAVAYVPVIASTKSEAAQLLESSQEATRVLKNDAEIIAHIKALKIKNSATKIAILVRSRSHLQEILPQLQAESISYISNELTSLAEQPVIIDLLSWLKALLNLEDRLAWLSILRVPWLEMDLPALQALFEQNEQIVWPRLNSVKNPDPKLSRILMLWEKAITQVRRQPLDQLLCRLWRESGAEKYWSSHDAQRAAKQFWQLLETHQAFGNLEDVALFERHLHHVSFTSEEKPGAIEIMTIHKAKGLEFDVVFLPALERAGQQDDAPLLVFDEVILPSGPKFLLAPLRQTGEDKNQIFSFIWQLQKTKARHERLRLLYVACTRAKEILYLAMNTEGLIKPRHGSFLADLEILYPLPKKDESAP